MRGEESQGQLPPGKDEGGMMNDERKKVPGSPFIIPHSSFR